MQLTNHFWRAIGNPARRWFLYDCPIRLTLTPEQQEGVRNDPLLRDMDKPRRPVNVSNHSFVAGTVTAADIGLIKQTIANFRPTTFVYRPLFTDRPIEHTVNTAEPIPIRDEVRINEDRVEPADVDIDALNLLHHDLQLRYASCYFIYKGSTYILSSFFIDRDKIKAEAILIKDGVAEKRITVEYSDDLIFTPPKLGYINYGVSSVFAERNHNVSSSYKYKRGFHDASCAFYNISDREVKSCGIDQGLGNPISTRRLVENIFNKEYPSYDEALEKVLSFSKLSCAFSSTLCIKLESLYNKFTLLKNTWTIAEYDTSTNSWQMLTNTFNEELSKLNIPHNPL